MKWPLHPCTIIIYFASGVERLFIISYNNSSSIGIICSLNIWRNAPIKPSGPEALLKKIFENCFHFLDGLFKFSAFLALIWHFPPFPDIYSLCLNYQIYYHSPPSASFCISICIF